MSSRKKPNLRPFVPLRRDMMDDHTYRNLSAPAKVIYSYLRKNSNGKWEERIPLPYSSINDMFARGTISKALKELISAGFIEQVSKGGMYGTPSFYRLTGEFANPYK